MANLSITAANVGLGNAARVRTVQVGEAVTHAQPLYLGTDNKYYKADANLSLAASKAVAVSLSSASTDGYVVIVETEESLVNLGATLTVGETYVVSATAGAICPIGDLTTGAYPCILGIATTTALLKLNIFSSGVAKP